MIKVNEYSYINPKYIVKIRKYIGRLDYDLQYKLSFYMIDGTITTATFYTKKERDDYINIIERKINGI